MGIGNWLSIASQVASVSAQVLPLIAEAVGDGEGGETGAYTLGDIEWAPGEDFHITAYNAGTDDNGLSYAVTTPDSNLSYYLVLPPDQHYDATDNLDQFRSGQLCISRLGTTASAAASEVGSTALAQSITFAMRCVALGVYVKLIAGIDVLCARAADGSYYVQVRFTGVAVESAQVAVTVSDARGGCSTTSAEATFTSSTDPILWTIGLPAGANLDPIVQDLEIRLDLNGQSTAAATRSRPVIRPGRPARLRRRAACSRARRGRTRPRRAAVKKSPACGCSWGGRRWRRRRRR